MTDSDYVPEVQRFVEAALGVPEMLCGGDATSLELENGSTIELGDVKMEMRGIAQDDCVDTMAGVPVLKGTGLRIEELEREREALEFRKHTEVLTPEEERELEEEIMDKTEKIKELREIAEQETKVDSDGEDMADMIKELDMNLDNMSEEERVCEAVKEFQEMYNDPRDITKSVYGEVAKQYEIRYMTVELERTVNDHYDRDSGQWEEVQTGDASPTL